MAGLRKRGSSLFIVDPSWIVRFRGEIPLSSLEAAWKSPAIEGCKWITAQFSDPPEIVDLQVFCRSAEENWKNMCESETGQMGIAGLKNFLIEIQSLGDFDRQTRMRHLRSLHLQTRAGVTERDGHGRFLGIVAKETAEPKLGSLSDLFVDIKTQWMICRNLCLRAQKTFPGDMVARLGNKVKKILDLEQSALAGLDRFLCRRGRLRLPESVSIGIDKR